MKNLLTLIMCTMVLLTAQPGFGQRTSPGDAGSPQAELMRRIDDKREQLNRRSGIDENGMMIPNEDPRKRPFPRNRSDGTLVTKEDMARIRAVKKPNESDTVRYAEFLSQPKTGIFRLFPYLNCVNQNVIRVDAECADFIPDGWAYSFRLKDYSSVSFFDLKYRDGELTAGSVLSLGVVTALGDVALEGVSLSSDGVSYLANLVPEVENEKIDKQREQFKKGVEADGFKYLERVKVQENTTYALRVVAYRMPGGTDIHLQTSDGYGNRPFPFNAADERKDVTVAFRIIRKEADNITILWKELARADSPKVVFPKSTKTLIVKSTEEIK